MNWEQIEGNWNQMKGVVTLKPMGRQSQQVTPARG